MANLSDAVLEYKSALDAAPTGAGPGAALAVAKIILARDRVARSLEEEGGPALSAEDLQALAEQDKRLKAGAKRYVALAGPPTFADWREVYRPRADAWWWHLDAPAEAAASKSYLIWACVAGVLFSVAASVVINTFQRIRGGEESFGDTLSTTLSVVFTLAAGTSLIQFLREIAQGLHRPAFKSWYFWGGTALLAAAVLAAAFLWRQPALSSAAAEKSGDALDAFVTERGREASESGEHSLALNPGNVQTRIFTAMAYEREGKFDEAIDHYLKLAQRDPNNCDPHNKIAAIYLRRGDYANARRHLDMVWKVGPCQEEYETQKHMGWAAFLISDLDGATKHLEKAIRKIEPEGSQEPRARGSHCLLAQVLEARRAAADEAARESPRKGAGQAPGAESEREAAEINQHWAACVRDLDHIKRDPAEPEWLKLAYQRLALSKARSQAAAARRPEGSGRQPR